MTHKGIPASTFTVVVLLVSFLHSQSRQDFPYHVTGHGGIPRCGMPKAIKYFNLDSGGLLYLKYIDLYTILKLI